MFNSNVFWLTFVFPFLFVLWTICLLLVLLSSLSLNYVYDYFCYLIIIFRKLFICCHIHCANLYHQIALYLINFHLFSFLIICFLFQFFFSQKFNTYSFSSNILPSYKFPLSQNLIFFLRNSSGCIFILISDVLFNIF